MSVQMCSRILLLFALVRLGHSLECFNCSATASMSRGDPCRGIGSVGKCQDPAICLSATYSYKVQYQGIRHHTTVKTCYPKMAGKECEIFLKNIKSNNPIYYEVEFADKCFTCEERGCNEMVPRESSTSANSFNVLPYILLASVLCYLTTFL